MVKKVLMSDFTPEEQAKLNEMLPLAEQMNRLIPSFQSCHDCMECWAYNVAVINPADGKRYTLCHTVSALRSTLAQLKASE